MLKRLAMDKCGYENINGIIALIIFIYSICIFGKYMLGDMPFYLPYNSDLCRANLPAYTLLYDTFFDNISMWSWSMGIGTSLLSHADIIFDPFTYISFLGGRDNIAYMMIWILIIKIIFQGISFSYYVREFNLNKYAVIISSVMYSFSGYSLIMGSNLALGTVLVYFPLVLLGIEKKLKHNNGKYLFTGLLLLCIYSYYFFYIVGLLTVFYLYIRCVSLNKCIWKSIIELAKYGVLVSLLSSFIIVPQIILATDSLRANEGKDIVFSIDLFRPHLKQIFTFISRSFGLNVLGDNSRFPYYGDRWDYFQCEIFVSSAFWLIFGQLIAGAGKYRKNVIVYTMIACIFLFVPYVSYFFNAFSTINYRWIFVIHYFCAFACAWGIHCIMERGVNKKALIISALLCGVFFIASVAWCTYARHFSQDQLFEILASNNRYYLWYLGFLLATVLIVYLLDGKNTKIYKRFIVVIVVIFCLGDYYVNYHVWYHTNELYGSNVDSKYGYDDRSNDVIKIIMSNDKSFFRIYKTFDSVYDMNNIPSNNDAMVQKYKGVKSYNSFNQPYYLRFLIDSGVYLGTPESIKKMKDDNLSFSEVKGQMFNYVSEVDDDYLLLDVLSVKYVISKENDILPENMELLSQWDGLKLYKNNNFLPVVRINDKYINFEDYKLKSYEERRKLLKNTTVVDVPVKVSVNEQSKCNLRRFDDNVLYIDADIRNQADVIVCSIPFDKGWEIYIDGCESQPLVVNGGMLGIYIEEGRHEIIVRYIPSGWFIGLMLSGITLVGSVLYFIPRRRSC